MKTPICPHRREARSLRCCCRHGPPGGLAAPPPAAAANSHAVTTPNAASSCAAPSDLFLNPFTYRSAHHRPIGNGAVYAGDSDPTTQSWLRGRNSWRVNSNNGWGRNVFLTSAADPETLINWSGDFGGMGLPTQLRVTVGANGRVNNSIVILVNGDTAQEFYRWWYNDGAPTAAIRRDWSLRDTGHGSSRGSSSASPPAAKPACSACCAASRSTPRGSRSSTC